MEALTLLSWVLDMTLGGTLIWLAWQTLASEDMFRAIVLFVSFGLLMALAWVRLDAPDIALAEAAIGAGLTGALLLGALARLDACGTDNPSLPESSTRSGDKPELPGWLLVFLVLMLGAGLGYAVLSMPTQAVGLGTQVADNIGNSGVSNPVTAVLLNFRAYDTLLEMVVLLLAVLGVWSLAIMPEHKEAAPGAVLGMLSCLLLPLLILVSGYLLWAGEHAPGGAFQAGSVLAAAGVLMLLTGWRPVAWFIGWPLRFLLVSGLAVFVLTAALMLLRGKSFLEFPPSHAGVLILLIEATAVLTIGVTLASLFLGGRPRPLSARSNRQDDGGAAEE